MQQRRKIDAKIAPVLRKVHEQFLLMLLAIILAPLSFAESIAEDAIDWAQSSLFDFSAQSTTGLDMAQVFSNIGMQVDPIMNFLVVLCYVVGVGLSVSAVMKLKKYGTRTAFMSVEMSMVGPMIQFFIGVALFYSPMFIASLNLTIFSSSGVEYELSYTSSTIDYDTYVEPVLGVIQIIGMIAFIRGWTMLSKATNPGQQPGAISKGLTHVVGGLLAVNIRTFITVVYQTLGLG